MAASALGVTSALGAWLAVPGDLAPVAAMLLGMLVGTLVALLMLLILTSILGGFELIVLSMNVGMLAGMIGAMIGSAEWTVPALAGLGVGLVGQSALHAVDRRLKGEVTPD